MMFVHTVAMACFHLLSYILLFCIISGRSTSASVSLDDFLPFGPENGDSQLRKDNDDQQPLYFPNSQLLPFYGKKYELLSVSYKIRVLYLNNNYSSMPCNCTVGEYKWLVGGPCR